MAPRVLSAGVVVVHHFAEGPRVLLLRAYTYWDFPKGRVEPGETPLAAALRETEEEAGLTALELVFGEEFIETAPYARNKVARYYMARSARTDVHLGISPTLGRPEHQEHRWVSLAEARALVVPRLHPVVDWAGARLSR